MRFRSGAEPAYSGLALGQDRHRYHLRDSLSGEDASADRIDQSIMLVAEAPPQSARAETSRSMPQWVDVAPTMERQVLAIPGRKPNKRWLNKQISCRAELPTLLQLQASCFPDQRAPKSRVTGAAGSTYQPMSQAPTRALLLAWFVFAFFGVIRRPQRLKAGRLPLPIIRSIPPALSDTRAA
jgi:hypothetical protein